MTKTAPVILAIETATRAGSISLARGEQILSTVTGDAVSSHSTDLIENIATVLQGGRATLNDIDLFAVASGPGSFTGLRIGLATAKSFAVNTGKQCVGVSTLAAIAHAAGKSRGIIVSLLPAGRGEVYAQMFSAAENKIESRDAASHIPPARLLEKYGHLSNLIWAGEGAQAHTDILRDWADAHGIEFTNGDEASLSSNQERRWVLVPASKELAVSVALLGLSEYSRGNTVTPEQLRATYVRPSDAEIAKPWRPQK
jgi:tRNA threonylcarbamoyladenosine biosynthesis protein TsaB